MCVNLYARVSVCDYVFLWGGCPKSRAMEGGPEEGENSLGLVTHGSDRPIQDHVSEQTRLHLSSALPVPQWQRRLP